MNPHRALSHGGIYAGNPPDDILGERSWVIEWWRQEYRACSNRYLDCTNLCESLGFRCRGSTTPLEPKYLSLDTWRLSEGQFDFTHITSYPSFTAQRGTDSHLWGWEWGGVLLKTPVSLSPHAEPWLGWVGRVWESSRWDSQRVLKEIGGCYSVSNSNRKPWDASGMSCLWIFPNWSTYTPNTTWTWPIPTLWPAPYVSSWWWQKAWTPTGDCWACAESQWARERP